MKQRLLIVLLLLVGCMAVNAQPIEVNWLNDLNPSPPNGTFWPSVTKSVYPLSVGIPMGILALGYAQHNAVQQRKGWNLMGALAVNVMVSQTIKYTVNRNRPYTEYPLIITPYDNKETNKSFPSGHTSSAFALAASLSIEFPKWYVAVPAYAYAASVGYSRLYLGEHYPSDVLAGAAVGIGSAYLSHWLGKKLFPKK